MIFRIVLVVIASIILIYLINYYRSNKKDVDHEQETFKQQNMSLYKDIDQQENADWFKEPQASDQDAINYRDVNFDTQKVPTDCFPRDRNTAEDLLPKDSANSKWSQVNPAGQGDVGNINFLTAGHHIGVNTVGSSMKNANLQLRSDPYIPTGRWPIMNSSIEPDVLRRPFEIGVSGDENCEQ